MTPKEHSPGPFSSSSNGRCINDAKGRRIAMLADYGTAPFEDGERQPLNPLPILANSRLFTAAPKLLAAAEAALMVLVGLAEPSGVNLAALRQQLTEAIGEANGRGHGGKDGDVKAA